MSYLFTCFNGDSLFFLLGDPYKWLEDVVPAWVITWDTSTWDEKHVVFSNERCETMSFPMKFFRSFSVSVSPGHSSGLCCHSIRRPRRLLGTGQHLGWSQVTVVNNVLQFYQLPRRHMSLKTVLFQLCWLQKIMVWTLCCFADVLFSLMIIVEKSRPQRNLIYVPHAWPSRAFSISNPPCIAVITQTWQWKITYSKEAIHQDNIFF